jgi:hypothetical protein
MRHHVGVPVAAVVIAAALSAGGTSGDVSSSPFAFFEPAIPISVAERAKLDDGEPVVKMLPARGRELALFAAVRVDASPERLIEWGRRVESTRNARYLPAVARFSNPPQLEDVQTLSLTDDDLEDLRRCRPGDCAVKLSAHEMARLQTVLDGSLDWKADAQRGFREAVVDRAFAYQARGDPGALPYADDMVVVAPNAEFALIVERLGFLQPQLPRLAEYLKFYPRVDCADVVESFLYWSTETLGIKPITNITHVTVVRGADPWAPEALVASKQVFASHYKNAALAVTAMVGSAQSGRYLVYIHRSHVDMLDGTLGGVVRLMIERRVRAEAPDVLVALRRKLEGNGGAR